MTFEWDLKKAESNLTKHQVSFEEAMTVFDDPGYLFFEDPADHGEERFIAVGMSNRANILLVVHCYKGR